MRDIKLLFEQREAIQAQFLDTSQIPRQPNGLILEADRKHWNTLLEHNDRATHELRQFNAGMTKAEQRALLAYKRAMKKHVG